jgi:hypothetical protein
LALTRLAKLRASDGKRGAWSSPPRDLNTRPLCEQITGRLTAAFCEWFMGYPENWTVLAGDEITDASRDSAIVSCPSSPNGWASESSPPPKEE